MDRFRLQAQALQQWRLHFEMRRRRNGEMHAQAVLHLAMFRWKRAVRGRWMDEMARIQHCAFMKRAALRTWRTRAAEVTTASWSATVHFELRLKARVFAALKQHRAAAQGRAQQLLQQRLPAFEERRRLPRLFAAFAAWQAVLDRKRQAQERERQERRGRIPPISSARAARLYSLRNAHAHTSARRIKQRAMALLRAKLERIREMQTLARTRLEHRQKHAAFAHWQKMHVMKTLGEQQCAITRAHRALLTWRRLHNDVQAAALHARRARLKSAFACLRRARGALAARTEVAQQHLTKRRLRNCVAAWRRAFHDRCSTARARRLSAAQQLVQQHEQQPEQGNSEQAGPPRQAMRLGSPAPADTDGVVYVTVPPTPPRNNAAGTQRLAHQRGATQEHTRGFGQLVLAQQWMQQSAVANREHATSAQGTQQLRQRQRLTQQRADVLLERYTWFRKTQLRNLLSRTLAHWMFSYRRRCPTLEQNEAF